MNKKEYKQFRRSMRDNGAAYTFRTWTQSSVIDQFRALYIGRDMLREREDIVSWCRRTGTEYNFHHLRSL